MHVGLLYSWLYPKIQTSVNYIIKVVKQLPNINRLSHDLPQWSNV